VPFVWVAWPFVPLLLKTFFTKITFSGFLLGNSPSPPVLRSGTAEGRKATARQVIKNIFVKVEVSAFSLGFQQNLAVVANAGFSLRGGRMAGCAKSKGKRKEEKVPQSNCANERRRQPAPNAFGDLCQTTLTKAVASGLWPDTQGFPANVSGHSPDATFFAEISLGVA
jgi:hypothetical protein